MKIDIYFIAKKAGVSPSTVSRVFNRSEIVSKAKKERVLEICKKYNYKPSFYAKSMRLKETRYLGFVIPDMVNPFFLELLQGAENFAHKNNYYLVLYNSENNYDKEMEFISSFLAKRIDGIIISSIVGGRKDNHFVKEVKRLGMPCVLVDRYIEGMEIPYVVTDNYKGGKIAAKYLLDLKHRKIGIVTFELKVRIIEDRYRGFTDELSKNKTKPVFCTEIPIGKLDIRSELENIKSMVINKGIDAIFCISDFIAINLIQFLKKENVKLPEDISILGFDNILSSDFTEPRLTTIAQDIYHMGETSVESLINQLKISDNFNNINHILEPKLIVRESCIKK